jgi:hypothetical protein
MGKRRIPTELEKLEARLIPGQKLSEMVFYTDITLALGTDVQRLVDKANDIRRKLTEQILEKQNAS